MQYPKVATKTHQYDPAWAYLGAYFEGLGEINSSTDFAVRSYR